MNETQGPQLAEIVATNLRAEMGAQKLTKSDLADLLNVGLPAATRRYDGDQALTLSEIDTVSSWLGVSRASLMAPRQAVAA